MSPHSFVRPSFHPSTLASRGNAPPSTQAVARHRHPPLWPVRRPGRYRATGLCCADPGDGSGRCGSVGVGHPSVSRILVDRQVPARRGRGGVCGVGLSVAGWFVGWVAVRGGWWSSWCSRARSVLRVRGGEAALAASAWCRPSRGRGPVLGLSTTLQHLAPILTPSPCQPPISRPLNPPASSHAPHATYNKHARSHPRPPS